MCRYTAGSLALVLSLLLSEACFGDEILATVNGKEITSDEVDTAFNRTSVSKNPLTDAQKQNVSIARIECPHRQRSSQAIP